MGQGKEGAEAPGPGLSVPNKAVLLIPRHILSNALICNYVKNVGHSVHSKTRQDIKGSAFQMF